jgi:drug/metabolite transporter (DMT)-like permease
MTSSMSSYFVAFACVPVPMAGYFFFGERFSPLYAICILLIVCGVTTVAQAPMRAGIQLVLSFLGYDIANLPRHPRHRRRP